ncbi:MAG: DUF2827 domain-containing protein [Comamonadaceae bacterium]|nr:MAG: DUF2827 domain-containing protein [Comamonadaceae bacterium]
MRIGISVITHEGQNIWENGMGQNVVFLAQLFRRLPFVTSVVLLDVGDQKVMPPQVDVAALGIQLMSVHQATDAVDVIFEMAGVLDSQWLALMRARGKKVVYYCCGQPYVGLIESAVFDRPGGYFPPLGRWDEIWMLSKDLPLVPMMRTIYRRPVFEVPFVWHPEFLQARIDEVAKHGLHFGHVPRQVQDGQERPGLRVAILEPNISVVKTSSIAMLACDEAYRAEPGSVAMMNVLNTLHLKDHPTMLYLANSLDLVKEHKAVFLGRHDIVGFMVQSADAVVSHQWANDQNYSYLDVLYGNYPLVHNSPWLHRFGAGYYYPGFDAPEGGRQLRLAAREHDERLDEQRRGAQAVFDAVDPFSERNLSAYAHALERLCNDSATRVAA